MFNPFDASNHSGLLTGMTRVHTGAQDSVERGALAGPAVMKAGALDVIKAGAALKAKVDLTPEFATALQTYMQRSFQPPTAASSEADKQLFATATYTARSDKTIKAFVDDLAVLLQLRTNLVLADADRAAMQTFVDNAPALIGAAEIHYDNVFSQLADAGKIADDAFDNFVDYIRSSVNLILRDSHSWVRGWDTIGKFPNDPSTAGIYAYNALYANYPLFISDRWTPTWGALLAETAIVVGAIAVVATVIIATCGAAGVFAGATAGPGVAAATSAAGAGATAAAGAAGGAAAGAAVAGATAAATATTAATVSLSALTMAGAAVQAGALALGSTIAGFSLSATSIAVTSLGLGLFAAGSSAAVEAARAALSNQLWSAQGPLDKDDMTDIFKTQKYYSGGPALTPLPPTNPPVKWKGKSVSGVTLSADGKRQFWYSSRLGWTFSPHPTAGVRLRYIGGEADAEPTLQGFLATNRWNAAFVNAVGKMGEIWPVAQGLSADLEDLKAKFAASSAKIKQSDAVKSLAEKGLKEGLATLDGKYKFSGFLAGYADILKNEVLDVADMAGQIASIGTTQEQISGILSKADKHLNDANAAIVQVLSATDSNISSAKQTEADAAINNAKTELKMADGLKAQGEAAITKINDAAARVSKWNDLGVAIPKVLKDKAVDTVKKAQAAADAFKGKEAEIDAMMAKADGLKANLAQAVAKASGGAAAAGTAEGGAVVTTGGGVSGGTVALAAVGGLVAILALQK